MDGRVILYLLGAAFIIGPGPETKALAVRVARALRPYSREQAAALMHLAPSELDAQLTGRSHLSLGAVARLPESVYAKVIE